MSNYTRAGGRKASTKKGPYSNRNNVQQDANNQSETLGRNENQDMDTTKQRDKTTPVERKGQPTSPHERGEEMMETDETAPPSTTFQTGPKQGSNRPTCQYPVDHDADISHNVGPSSPRHAQAQEMLLRQKEASKQMLYGVFGNVITILEEHEKRTSAIGKGKMKQSDIHIPDQSWKTNEDVKANVETQLLLFQTQSKFCPEEVRLSVNDELRLKTIAWFGVREDSKLDIGETDEFACRLYEILVKGATQHDILDRPRSPVTEKTMRETLPGILRGKHDARELDDSFKKDKNKKAETPKTRQAEVDDAYMMGLSRIERTEPKLKKFLDEDFSLIQYMGPKSIC
ncbi:hypothetical protein MAR_002142 [Mya arenaria]|uniref:Uncharacterized protein n=1 Tax=Mya arenaria TaxID=6604 RepID=A0ABY7FGK5_MYAAR|nr:uncharacterized protein LOC128208819 isoform X1 [Mya arenaria]XP_052768405.1 uncharacterized protein LOC128208819 isoform X1 [Mya arenaria]WAR20304.1 hypothetical protein MAR_002142 [Mya arenaria]